LETIIRKLKIHHLKAQLSLRDLICESLAEEFEMVPVFEQRAVLAPRCDATLKERHALQFMLALLERQQKQERSGVDSLVSGD
jgi:hypothetical protein